MYAITRTHLQLIFTIIAKNHKRVHVDAEGSCYKNAERGMDSRMNQAQTGRRPNAGKEADSKKPKGGTIFSPRYDSMPIVGVGASAGDLEASEQLFTKMQKEVVWRLSLFNILIRNNLVCCQNSCSVLLKCRSS